MKPEGNTSHLRCGIKTFKFVCLKMKWTKCDDGKYRRRHLCDNPCTSSPCGRMIYIYPEKDLRAYPDTLRNTEEWDDDKKYPKSAFLTTFNLLYSPIFITKKPPMQLKYMLRCSYILT